jgi:hypothetical protein
MMPSTKRHVANGVMLTGLLPYIAVLVYVVHTSGSKGDAAMGAIFMIILGLGLAYLVALVVALPAFFWSLHLATASGTDTRFSIVLRWAVMCGVFPALVIFPIIAAALMR